MKPLPIIGPLLLVLGFAIGATIGLAQNPPAPPPKPGVKAVTREVLEKRLAELQQARDRVMADYNAVTGAIQETQHWLDELKAAEAPPAKEKKEPARPLPKQLPDLPTKSKPDESPAS